MRIQVIQLLLDVSGWSEKKLQGIPLCFVEMSEQDHHKGAIATLMSPIDVLVDFKTFT